MHPAAMHSGRHVERVYRAFVPEQADHTKTYNQPRIDRATRRQSRGEETGKMPVRQPASLALLDL